MKLNKINDLFIISIFLIICLTVTSYVMAQSHKYPPVPPPKRETKTVIIKKRSASKPPTKPPKRSSRSPQENIENANPPTKPPTGPEPGNSTGGTGGIKKETVDISSAIDMSIKVTRSSIVVNKTIKKGSFNLNKVVPLNRINDTNVTKGKVSKKPYQKK